jgi:hypothetical protein
MISLVIAFSLAWLGAAGFLGWMGIQNSKLHIRLQRLEEASSGAAQQTSGRHRAA